MLIQRSSAEIGRQRRTAGARGRCPDRFVLRGEPPPEAQASRVPWTKDTVGGTYFAQFYQQTSDNAARLAREHALLTPGPPRYVIQTASGSNG